jgi:hypothetical protein
MSTNGMTSWAVDLKDVGAIYPFQGTEVILVIIGLAFWIWFHIYQFRQEDAEIKSEMDADKRGELAKKSIEGY